MIFVECFHHTKYTRFMILSCLSECQTIVGRQKFAFVFPEHIKNDDSTAVSNFYSCSWVSNNKEQLEGKPPIPKARFLLLNEKNSLTSLVS